jgi:DNA 3'-phosphatase
MKKTTLNTPQKRRQLVLTDKNKKEINFKVAFFDADSTLRVAKSGRPSPSKGHDVELLPCIIPVLRSLVNQGYLLAIVSNQAGVQHGHLKLSDAEAAMNATVQKIAEHGVVINYFDFADRCDEYRKPQPGMALYLEKVLKEAGLKLDWKNSLMVGDAAWKKGKEVEPDGTPGVDHSNSDRVFAENIARKNKGFDFAHPADFFGWKRHFGIRNFSSFDHLEKFRAKFPNVGPDWNSVEIK